MPDKRKPRGKPFQKGHPGGPGRKPKSTEDSELQRLLNIVTADDRDELLRKGLSAAKAGKPWAWQWFADRLWPEQFVAAKINEKDGAKDAAEGLTDTLRTFLASLKASVNGGIA